MTKKLLLMLLAAIWTLNATEARAQQRTKTPAFEHVHSLNMDANGQSLLLGAHTGLFRSDDGGRNWKKVALSEKHPHLDVMTVTPDPKDPQTIYVGTHEAGVFKSDDGGVTWKQVNNGLGGMDAHGLAVDPKIVPSCMWRYGRKVTEFIGPRMAARSGPEWMTVPRVKLRF